MRNFVQAGCNLDLTAPRALASGEGFIVGALFAVASTTAASGAVVVGVTEGVFTLPKKTTAAIAAGGRVSWDNTNHQCDAPGTGFYPVGVAVAAAGNGAATVTVRLDGVSTAAAA
ncbi:DUF2190 family protein [Azospirillum formosense]|uniref:DUF2190 family protein n=1 Tax=Azospirillum formosense TaxID=861533 RepID=A0ABX2KTW6_9PROT|nr:capsid cement protein [Azospirillum formosense]MBY3752758.1 DUF2190 family protein [Azospirillum formosense]NUB18254.1 DUF2190 family protein [Azospirillum formosense]